MSRPYAIRTNRVKEEDADHHALSQSDLLRLNNEFGILNCQDGDALLYIGPPPQTLSESQTWDHAYVQNHFSFPHRVHSSKFLGLGSKKFNELFGPRSVRTERRLRKEGILSRVSTEGIKFFVDLRPPTEDDEAIVLLTTLTCTKGVLTWHMAQAKYGISTLLVAGQDDFPTMPVDLHVSATPQEDIKGSENSKLHRPSDDVNEPWERPDFIEAYHEDNLIDLEPLKRDLARPNQNADPRKPSAASVATPQSTTKSPKSSVHGPAATDSFAMKMPVAMLPEYSPLRHRSAIERLVQAIEDGDPKLDSAPKVWTFFAVAKYFDCASHEKVSGFITRWLLSHPNSNFIQCNPEVTLRIGLGTQSEDVTKDAFSILVGEKSLLNLMGETHPFVLNPLVTSGHGRRLELLDDDERNRIDHAAASLVRRIRQKFDDLVGEEMAWLQQSSFYQKISSMIPHSQVEADLIRTLIQKVKQYVRGRIVWVLCRTYDDDFGEFEQTLKQVRAFYPGTRDTFRETYNGFNERERIFTRFFWVALYQEHFADGNVNLWTERNSRLGLPDAGSTFLSQKLLDETMPNGERMCQIVSKKELNTLLSQFNQIGRNHGVVHEAEQPMVQTFPGRNAEAVPATSAWAYNGFNGSDWFDNPAATATSPKRDQPAVPDSQMTEKRRKLSAAATSGSSSALESMPIRLRTGSTKRNDEYYDQAENSSRHHGLESPVNENVPLAQYDAFMNSDGIMEPRITPYPQVPDEFMSLAGESRIDAEAERFGHEHFRTQDFQPSLPKLPRTTLSMSDATYRQRMIDVFGKTYPVANQNDQQAEVMRPELWEAAEHWKADTDKDHQNRVITADDFSYDTDDGDQGRVITAEDWSSQADDNKATRGRVMQQFSDHPKAPEIYTQGGLLKCAALLHDLSNVLHRICYQIAYPSHLFCGDYQLPVNLIDTLTCLDDDEWKYLPLWAGGNDDETGGVFDEVDVPNLEAGGFKGGKRGMGSTSDGSASSSVSASSFDDIGSDAVSTVGKASRAATDGTQTVKSLSDVGSEDEDFMRQNELWDEIRNMKFDGAASPKHGNGTGVDKGKARAEEYDDSFDGFTDERDADEVNTVVGPRSSDGGDERVDGSEEHDDVDEAFGDGDDEDMEIIDADDVLSACRA